MANVYDWQVGPNGELINTGSPDYGAPPPARPSWNPPDRISSGVNAPSPSLLSGAGSNPNMGYPAQGLTLNTSGPDSGLDQSAPNAPPNPGGSLDFSKLLSSINPISSAEAATLPRKQPYGPQVPPGGLPSQQPSALTGLLNNIHSGSAAAFAAAHHAANAAANATPNMAPFAAAAGGGEDVQPLGPAAAKTASPMDPYITLPPFTAQAPPRQRGPSAPRSAAPSGSSWLGSPNMNNAALGDQIMGGNMFGGGAQQRAPVQGPMAAFGPQASSPFTWVLRPNADPTNSRGGTPLATALDLSGYQPPPPPAPPSYNLGYGGGGRGPAPVAAPRPFRAQAPSAPGIQAAAARMAPGYSQAAGSGGFMVDQPLGPPQKAPPISQRFNRKVPDNPVPGNPFAFIGGGV